MMRCGCCNRIVATFCTACICAEIITGAVRHDVRLYINP